MKKITVLVWKQYGCVDVINANTAQRCRQIASDVVEVINGWCCEEFAEDLETFTKRLTALDRDHQANDIRRLITNLVCDVCEDTDDFEYFEFNTVEVDDAE